MVQAPQKPDVCQNGFKVGEVLSKTVSRLVVPQLLDADPEEDPLAQTPEAEALRELIQQSNVSTNQFEAFEPKQQKIIDDYEKIIQDAVEQRIKCFTEELFPVEEVSIKFVCAKEGAFNSIEEAL